jgi:hypothetical protein
LAQHYLNAGIAHFLGGATQQAQELLENGVAVVKANEGAFAADSPVRLRLMGFLARARERLGQEMEDAFNDQAASAHML